MIENTLEYLFNFNTNVDIDILKTTFVYKFLQSQRICQMSVCQDFSQKSDDRSRI
jgi:hypothetical protein